MTMKINCGLAEFELGRFTPSTFVAVGPEDQMEELRLGPAVQSAKGGAAPKKQRRGLSITFTPLGPDVNTDELLQTELNRFISVAGAKVGKIEDRQLNGHAAKMVELRFTGPNQLPLCTLALIAVANGFQQLYIMTALDSKSFGDARQEFLSLVESAKINRADN
jgi:hypothetical protein